MISISFCQPRAVRNWNALTTMHQISTRSSRHSGGRKAQSAFTANLARVHGPHNDQHPTHHHVRRGMCVYVHTFVVKFKDTSFVVMYVDTSLVVMYVDTSFQNTHIHTHTHTYTHIHTHAHTYLFGRDDELDSDHYAARVLERGLK